MRGVVPVHIPAVWQLNVPPKIHILMWLLSHNKLLTRDNMNKPQHALDLTCLFYLETETCFHLFFGFVVSVEVWRITTRPTGFRWDINMMPISNYWSMSDSFAATNIIHASGIWAIRETRNDISFNRAIWNSM